jgi:hypothetical protein
MRWYILGFLFAFGFVATGASQAEPPAETRPAGRLRSPGVWLGLAAIEARSVHETDPSDPIGILDFIGQGQAQAGDVPGATGTAREIAGRARQSGQVAIATMDRLAAASVFISAGKPEMARPLLAYVEKQAIEAEGTPGGVHVVNPRDVDYDWAFENLAMQQARLGQLEKARATIDRIDVYTSRASAWCSLSGTLLTLHR